MQLYRIASSRHPVWDGTGAAILGGRWNSAGQPVIYASVTYAGAMLEVLAHTNTGKVPPSHRCVTADVPDELEITRLDLHSLPSGWDDQDSAAAQIVGDEWLRTGRSAVLLVPSVLTRIEFNALVNPIHPDAAKIKVSEPQTVLWDHRLFSRD
jgi:RES domain-containing protein